jgi:stage II sporulation protein E
VGVYGFAGLLAGCCRDKKRLPFAVWFVLANCAATLWGLDSDRALAGLYECFCASVFFLVVPQGTLAGLQGRFSRPEQAEGLPALPSSGGKRLRQAAQALEALSMALTDVTDRLGRRNEQDIAQVFRRASDKVCGRCPVRGTCWDKDYVTTMGAMNDVTQRLRGRGKLEPEDFPFFFAARCLNMRQFTGAVNDEYAAWLRRRRQQAQRGGARQLMRRQYEGIQGLLQDMAFSAEQGPEYYPSLQNRAQNIAAAYFRRPTVQLYCQQGRMYCEIRVGDPDDLPEDAAAFTRSLSLALGRDFGPLEPQLSARGMAVRCNEQERFAVETGWAQRKKEGQAVSGDQQARFLTEDGRAVIMLADGMGSGEGAAAVSMDALSLIGRFAKAGCSLCESARAVVPMLAARLEERGFTTLDLLEIDLFSGRCALTKYGAAPTWLLAGGRARKLESRALAAGLEAGAPPPEPEYFTLREDCRILMVSDGAAEGLDEPFLLEYLRLHPGADDPEELARGLTDRAVPEDAPDDRTAVSVRRQPSV